MENPINTWPCLNFLTNNIFTSLYRSKIVIKGHIYIRKSWYFCKNWSTRSTHTVYPHIVCSDHYIRTRVPVRPHFSKSSETKQILTPVSRACCGSGWLRGSLTTLVLLIHEADSQSQPVVINISACGGCTSVRPSVLPSNPTFQNISKQNDVQARIMIATGGTVGQAKWIIDDTHVLKVLNLSQISSTDGTFYSAEVDCLSEADEPYRSQVAVAKNHEEVDNLAAWVQHRTGLSSFWIGLEDRGNQYLWQTRWVTEKRT